MSDKDTDGWDTLKWEWTSPKELDRLEKRHWRPTDIIDIEEVIEGIDKGVKREKP